MYLLCLHAQLRLLLGDTTRLHHLPGGGTSDELVVAGFHVVVFTRFYVVVTTFTSPHLFRPDEMRVSVFVLVLVHVLTIPVLIFDFIERPATSHVDRDHRSTEHTQVPETSRNIYPMALVPMGPIYSIPFFLGIAIVCVVREGGE